MPLGKISTAVIFPGSLRVHIRSGLCCDGNWVSADCSKTMNQLQPIFNNEELKHNQKYIHSATAFRDYMQQLVPAASLWAHILSLAFFFFGLSIRKKIQYLKQLIWHEMEQNARINIALFCAPVQSYF